MGFKDFVRDPVGSVSSSVGKAGGSAASTFFAEIPWGKIVMGLGVVVIVAAVAINQAGN